MILVLTPETVANRQVLEAKAYPRRILALGLAAYPRGQVLTGLFWRTVFEKSLPRYAVALLPFVVAAILRPEWSLALSQAPLAMFAVVLLIETYVLSVSGPDARRALSPPDEAARTLDLLRVRAEAALTRFMAARGMTEGTLHLVVETSGLLRVPPLTYISVQRPGRDGAVLTLSPEERAGLAATLFDSALDERVLRRVNVARNALALDFPLEAASISAHARLTAMAARAPG